jgi:hypothetical protein
VHSAAQRRALTTPLIEYYHQQMCTALAGRAHPSWLTVAALQRAYTQALPFALNGQLLAVSCICDWNKANMNDDDREALFATCDALLDDVIANMRLGAYD